MSRSLQRAKSRRRLELIKRAFFSLMGRESWESEGWPEEAVLMFHLAFSMLLDTPDTSLLHHLMRK